MDFGASPSGLSVPAQMSPLGTLGGGGASRGLSNLGSRASARNPGGLLPLAYDAFSNPTAGTGELSWTHTPVGTPRGVIVLVVTTAVNINQVSGATYAGAAMTEVTGSPLLKIAAGELFVVNGFFLGSSITAGAQTAVVSVSGAAGKQAICISVTAGSDTSVVDTDVTINSNSVENPSATLSLSSIICFCAIGFGSGVSATTGITPSASWTDRLEHDFGVRSGGFYTYDTVDSADVAAGWTQVADDALGLSVAIRQG